jgi:hypothetical protein
MSRNPLPAHEVVLFEMDISPDQVLEPNSRASHAPSHLGAVMGQAATRIPSYLPRSTLLPWIRTV